MKIVLPTFPPREEPGGKSSLGDNVRMTIFKGLKTRNSKNPFKNKLRNLQELDESFLVSNMSSDVSSKSDFGFGKNFDFFGRRVHFGRDR